jgi:hypothetical protein
MKYIAAIIGAVVLGHVWLMLYNYASGFEDVFILGAVGAASLGWRVARQTADA